MEVLYLTLDGRYCSLMLRYLLRLRYAIFILLGLCVSSSELRISKPFLIRQDAGMVSETTR